HPPQSSCPPQPLPTMPQYWPFACMQLGGVQPTVSRAAAQTSGRPAPPQDKPPGHAPQSMRPPQPLPTMPQYWPFAWTQLGGVQAPESGAKPHTLSMPAPPHVCAPGHEPQSILPPQPSPTTPQYWPLACMQLCGVQPMMPHKFGML